MTKKRVLLVAQNFYPETFKSNDIAFEMTKRGYDVSVLTAIPNYPEGVFYDGYGIFKRRVETVDGVKVYRALLTPRGRKASPIGLSLNYITYALFATLWVLFFFVWRKKYDAIIVHQTSPITQAIPAIILGKLRRTKVYTWVLDIWPDSVVSTIGERKSRFIIKPLNWITDWVYRNSYKILISSKGHRPLVNRNNDYSDKIIHFPNWCDDIMKMPKLDAPQLPNGYVIMMAGNIADGIGVDSVVALVEELKDVNEVKFVFVGGGAKVDDLQKIFVSKGLQNAYLMGRYPFAMMPAFYSQADAMLLTLKKTYLPHLSATVPARLQSYMSAGKPVLGMVSGDAANLINELDCGFCVPAGEYKELAEYIRNVVLPQKSMFEEKGIKSRFVFEQYFTKSMCMNKLEKYLDIRI